MATPTLSPTGIRQDLVTRLKAANTAAGQRVYDSRKIALDTDEIPCITVYSEGMSESKWAMGAPLYRHTERVGITGIVGGNDDATIAASLDTLEDAILSALATDTEWLGSFETVASVETVKSLDLESNRRLGGVAIKLEVTYSTIYTPNLTGMDLEEIAITTESTNPDGANVSERVIEVSEEE